MTAKAETTKIIKKNGVAYTVRHDRRRYFYPDEWDHFIKLIKDKEHRFFFLTAIHTGGRIMEILNLNYGDIDTERGTITFNVVKQRKARKDYTTGAKNRAFFVSSEFLREYKAFIRGKTIKPQDYIFLDNSKLPRDYKRLTNEEKRPFYASKLVSYSQMLKRYVKKAKIEDYYNFAPHNIRKTYGMFMRTFNIEIAELCYRLGHDTDTYLTHYGSSLIFTDAERHKIAKIYGEVK